MVKKFESFDGLLRDFNLQVPEESTKRVHLRE